MRVIIWVITVQQFAGGLWERGEYLGFKKEIRRQLQIEIFNFQMLVILKMKMMIDVTQNGQLYVQNG